MERGRHTIGGETMQKHVVVIGAGFAGLYAVQELLKDTRIRVTLVDRHNYHLFVPLLYQVAIAGLESSDIAHPARDVLKRHPRASFVMGEVSSVDRQKRVVTVEDEELPYDYLIVASGSQTNTLGVPGVEEHAIGLKGMHDALRIRDRILSACEEASHLTDPDQIRPLLTFLVVGGGPTGVELAGSLGEVRRRILPRYYPEIDRSLFHVMLIESSPRVLSVLSEKSSTYAERSLKDFDVELRLGTRVAEVTPHGVHTEDGEFIESFTTIWAAGVTGAPVEGVEKPGRGGRVQTTPYLHLEDDRHVYVTGDVNGYIPPRKEKPLPQVAPMAMQQGVHAARNVLRDMAGERLKRFRYKDRGTMVTVGRKRAVVERGWINFSGFPAWFAWFAVHLVKLTGGRNRVRVFLNWVYNYLRYDYAERVIYNRERFPKAPGASEDKEFEQVAGS
jgi:NADH:ubiquinone reductase (H+-translocating)